MTTVMLREMWRFALGASVYLLAVGSFALAQGPSFEGLNWEVEVELEEPPDSFDVSILTSNPQVSRDGSAIFGHYEAPEAEGFWMYDVAGVFHWPTQQRWGTYGSPGGLYAI